ncbi:MAG: electron transport complex subunit RsxB [Betaproteobacteria bacterium]
MTKSLPILADRILDALPQTQCTRCGYADCRAYARALAQGQAQINQCPPGGQEGIVRLAAITGLPVLPLSQAHGTEGPRAVAVIDEDWCIGCTLCQPVCPPDAIVGGNKLMHTVMEQHCTGCELCLPACPVDCIRMEVVTETTGWQAWSGAQALQARSRYVAHQERQSRTEEKRADERLTKAQSKLADLGAHSQISDAGELDRKKAVIQAALARAQNRRKGTAPET